MNMLSSVRKLSLCVVVLLGQALFMSASADDWKLGLGISYRKFDDIEFKSRVIRRSQFPTSNYTNFFVDEGDATGQTYDIMDVGSQGQGVLNLGAPFDPVAVIAADSATWQGGDESESEPGFVLSAEKRLWSDERFSLSLDLSLSYFNLSTSVGASAGPGGAAGFSVSSDDFYQSIGAPQPLVDATRTAVTTAPAVVGAAAALRDAQISLRSTLDMDMLVLGVGLKAGVEFKRVSLCMAAGPALSIADVETSYRQRITSGGGATDVLDDDDGETAVRPGLYAACGIGVQLTERLGLSALYRYDDVSNDSSTDHANVDLSGSSAEIKLTIAF